METKTAEMMGKQMLQAVVRYVGRALAPLSSRLTDLDAKISAIPAGKDGASIHPDTVALMIREAVDKAVSALPRELAADGRDGRDAAELDPLTSIDLDRSYPRGTWASHAGGLLRASRNTDPLEGRDVVSAGWVVMVDGLSAVVVTQGENPLEISVAAMLTSGTKAITAFSIQQVIGKGVSLDAVRRAIEADTARLQTEFERRASDIVRSEVEKIPPAKSGKDGRDAVQLDGFDAALDGRILKLSLTAGERVISKDIRLPIPIDRGVYRFGAAYEKGDVITYGGSQWIALKDTSEKPPSDSWRLCVAKGRDGKSS